MVPIRSGLEQWHEKSVRVEQPSELSAVTKQLREQLGRLERSWAKAMDAMRTMVAVKVFILIELLRLWKVAMRM